MKVLVTGGYFDDSGECWIRLVDLAAEQWEDWLHWRPPEHLLVPTKGFAGGCLAGESLYVAAHGSVVRVNRRTAQVNGILHHPGFNDLHHVAVDGDRLLVTNTGGNAVESFSLDGQFLGAWSLTPSWAQRRAEDGETPANWQSALQADWEGSPPDPWERKAGDNYYTTSGPFWRRKVRDYLHINHVLPMPDGSLLATCLQDGSFRDVSQHRIKFRCPELHPHDGLLLDEDLWFTSIDGGLWRSSLSGSANREIDTFATGQLGWCRGLWIQDGLAAIGTTEVRPGRLPQLRWSDADPTETRTGVGLFDLGDGMRSAWVDLTDKDRHSKVFSILPLDSENTT